MPQQVGPRGRDTIVIFDPVLIDSDRLDLSSFLESFVRREGLFRFRINPEAVRVNKSKLTATVLTEAGYERAYFGNALTTLSYRGNTGHFWLPQAPRGSAVQSIANSTIFADIKLSPIYQKFVQFEEWFESLDRDVALLDHRGTLYRGAHTTFGYEERAERPWEITYEFAFEAYTDEMYGDRLGQAIKRLGKYENLNKNYVAALTYRALVTALGNTDSVSSIPWREGISKFVGVLP